MAFDDDISIHEEQGRFIAWHALTDLHAEGRSAKDARDRLYDLVHGYRIPFDDEDFV